MSQRRLRLIPRVSYEELEEPRFDEYVYCEKCGEHVYEYCSIHGPLVVVPDNKVSQKLNRSPMKVPRAALTIPNVFLHLDSSSIPGAGVGVFATLTLPSGVRFGPYRGERTQQIDSAYCWQIYDSNNKPSHVIDGGDSAHSNWMRYVNCARHSREQNLVAYQYQGDVYYRTIKIIPRSTELLVFYGSEYAATLQIDLSKYHVKNFYPKATGIHLPTFKRNNKTTIETEISQKPYVEEVTTTTLEIARTDVYTEQDVSEDYEIEDFQYIDDTSMLTEDTSGPTVEDNELLNVDSENQFIDIEFPDNHLADIRTKVINSKHTQTNPNSIDVKIVTNNKMTQVDFNSEDNQPSTSNINVKIKNERLDEIHHTEDTYNNKNVTKYENKFTKIIADKVTWQCKDCHKVLSSRSSLKGHAQTHSEFKAYKCSECEYGTNHKYRLNRHMAFHTRIYEFKCELCVFATNSKVNLKNHVQRIHVKNEFNYHCEFCQYKVYSKTTMESHKALHGNINAYKCEFCDYLCKKMRYLRSHVMAVHKKTQK